MFGYCSIIWSPFLVKDITLLESVLRRMTKLQPRLSNLTHSDRISACGHIGVFRRHERAALMFYYKVLVCTQNFDFSYMFNLSPAIFNRGHTLKLRGSVSRLDCHKFSFSERYINSWNALPCSVVQASSPLCFKRAMDLYLYQF